MITPFVSAYILVIAFFAWSSDGGFLAYALSLFLAGAFLMETGSWILFTLGQHRLLREGITPAERHRIHGLLLRLPVGPDDLLPPWRLTLRLSPHSVTNAMIMDMVAWPLGLGLVILLLILGCTQIIARELFQAVARKLALAT